MRPLAALVRSAVSETATAPSFANRTCNGGSNHRPTASLPPAWALGTDCTAVTQPNTEAGHFYLCMSPSFPYDLPVDLVHGQCSTNESQYIFLKSFCHFKMLEEKGLKSRDHRHLQLTLLIGKASRWPWSPEVSSPGSCELAPCSHRTRHFLAWAGSEETPTWRGFCAGLCDDGPWGQAGAPSWAWRRGVQTLDFRTGFWDSSGLVVSSGAA